MNAELDLRGIINLFIMQSIVYLHEQVYYLMGL